MKKLFLLFLCLSHSLRKVRAFIYGTPLEKEEPILRNTTHRFLFGGPQTPMGLELRVGLEPTTYCLQGSYSTNWVIPAKISIYLSDSIWSNSCFVRILSTVYHNEPSPTRCFNLITLCYITTLLWEVYSTYWELKYPSNGLCGIWTQRLWLERPPS